MNAVAERGLERIVKSGETMDALFKSTHGALKFALNHTQSTLTKCTLAGLLGGAGRPGRGLAGLDGAAQAGMIQCELGELPRHYQAMLIARLMVPTTDCSCKSQCCQGFRPAPAWAWAIEELSEYALKQGLTGTVSHRRVRDALVTRYFGIRVVLKDVAKACGISENTMGSYNKQVVEHLRAQEPRAMMAISERLYIAGIVE